MVIKIASHALRQYRPNPTGKSGKSGDRGILPIESNRLQGLLLYEHSGKL